MIEDGGGGDDGEGDNGCGQNWIQMRLKQTYWIKQFLKLNLGNNTRTLKLS